MHVNLTRSEQNSQGKVKSDREQYLEPEFMKEVFIHAKLFFCMCVCVLFYNLKILRLEQTLLAKCSKKLNAIKRLEIKLQRGPIVLLFCCACGRVCVCVVCV